MGQFLLVMRSDESEFETQEVAAILSKIPGVSDLKCGGLIGSILQCDYAFEDDRTTVRLSDDLESVTIDGIGVSSLMMALELQRLLGTPLRVVDSNYNFDFGLADIDSIHELRKRISTVEE